MVCTAPNCGNIQCYVCSKSCNGYDHFDDLNRGGSKSNCPLFDNQEERHDREVRAAEESARRLAKEEDPNVDANMLAISYQISVDEQKRRNPNQRHGTPQPPGVNMGFERMELRGRPAFPRPTVAIDLTGDDEDIPAPKAEPRILGTAGRTT
ncbi:hypothetical protein OQA88_2405 [Cercophora sp. LCS_1]